MLKHGYYKSHYNSSVYFRILAGGDRIYVLLYVDDLLTTCKYIREIEKLKKELNFVLEMKDIGAAIRILGMQIVRDKRTKTLFLTQAEYNKKVLSKFAMSDSKHVSTPLATHFRLSKIQEPMSNSDIQHIKKIPYSTAVVGYIMYAIVWSRPDLPYCIQVVSRFMGNPGKVWNAVKWVLRYL